MKRGSHRLRFTLDVTVWMGMPVDDPVLAELPWLRKLARRLAADDAEDLVQETWLMARRYEPTARGGSGLRPWLAQTMKNRLRSFRRSATARSRREAQASPSPEVAAAAEQRAIEIDVIRMLDEALQTLSEEQRALVRERFYAERSPAEIAAELEMPAATVRTKLRRSLLRLREVLDERHGNDRARWASAVVAVPLPRTAAQGGIAMASTKGIVVAVAVAGIVAAAWFWRSEDEGAAHEGRDAAAAGQYEASREFAGAAAAEPGTARAAA
ncbi:MAG: sigma-70 family RNA polymerase sigma factor, partial [Myxococcota bacterium]